MSSEVAIRVQGLGKCFHIYEQSRARLRQFTLRPLRRFFGLSAPDHFKPFWALRDVSFEVRRGETVGIVGGNGSGKSTLLQLICGTLSPTEGTVHTHGRVGALLELGSGFNPEFSGRENIFLNAAILGMSREETQAKFDAIVRFADIGEHLEQPVKTYSSGMAVRLAFAVQSHADPEILVVDEALAVGDAKFQAKCFERLKQLRAQGTSILLVTHDSAQVVTHCDRAILLRHGAVQTQGIPRDVINAYHEQLFGKPTIHNDDAAVSAKPVAVPHPTLNSRDDVFASRAGHNPHEHRWGDQAATLLDFCLSTPEHSYPSTVRSGQPLTLEVMCRFNAAVHQPILGVTVKTHEGVTISGTNTQLQVASELARTWQAGETLLIQADWVCHLGPGDYFISVGIASQQHGEVVPHDRRYDSIHLTVLPTPDFFGLANLQLGLQARALTP
jgi:lipopolysaccharide transport system ATP-binding protein